MTNPLREGKVEVSYPFKVTIRGLDVYCENKRALQEVLDLAGEFPSKPSTGGTVAAVLSDFITTNSGPPSLKDPAIHARALKAIAESHEGILTPVLAGLVGITPGLVGPLKNALNANLLSHGYDPPSVYVVETISGERKLWKRGPRISDAIADL